MDFISVACEITSFLTALSGFLKSPDFAETVLYLDYMLVVWYCSSLKVFYILPDWRGKIKEEKMEEK